MVGWPWPEGDPESRGEEPVMPSSSVDERLSRNVTQRLRADASHCFGQVAVEAQNGVALLSGVVESHTHREIAGQVARDTQGVRDVCNMLSVASPDDRPTGGRLDHERVGLAGERPKAGDRGQAGDTPVPRHPTRPVVQRQTRVGARLLLGFAICWWLLCVLLVTLGTTGIVIWCLALATALAAYTSRRGRGR
ncbi:BON domain-containing protein [Paractinoplanes hotanensis]|uniref:BON domain-containing protein n=1 Tax=Paractinoplanes hotanensis TaxID=2906497 RepID=UPI0034DAF9F0